MANKKKATGVPKPPVSSGSKALRQARSGSRGNTWFMIGGGLLVVALLVAVIVAVIAERGTRQQQDDATNLGHPAATTAIGAASLPPWPAPADAGAAVRAAGLPMLAAEGVVEHIHAHLDVRVDGQPITVPAFLGIDRAHGTISPLHIHDTTGVLHIESPVKRQFSLGELFTEWNVALSADRIGGLNAAGGKTLRAFVNGQQWTGDPAAILFNAHDEIVLIYGQPQPGESIPARYDFPSGE